MNRDSWRLGTDMNDYRSLVLSLSPVAYWRLGERSGTVVDDETGHYPGTYVNAPTLGVPGALAGDANTAVALNGTTQYATIVSLPLLQTLSISAWVKIAVAGTYVVIGQGLGGFQLYPNGDGSITLDVNGGGPVLSAVPGSFTFGPWHHVVASYGPTSGSVYVDGVAVSTTWAARTFTAVPETVIGAQATTLNFKVSGSIDEVAIWSRALTAADVAAMYQTGRKYR